MVKAKSVQKPLLKLFMVNRPASPVGAAAIDREIESHTAPLKDDGPIGHPDRLGHVVGDHHDGPAVPGAQPEHQVLHIGSSERIEGPEGLVEQEQGRSPGDRAGE